MRCAIVLAGGHGARLRDIVYRLRGDELPKQYNNFVGRRSMLEHTLHRTQKLIPAERVFTVIVREHLKYCEVIRQIGARPSGTVIVQPENKDNAPGVLLSLLHLQKRFSTTAVALFPSDHYILEEDLFMRHVDRAFEIVAQDTSRIVLLGVEPYEPDPEYGYIVPGQIIEPSVLGARKVELFVEKPATESAEKLIGYGALWNTMAVISSCETLLCAIQAAQPETYRSFAPIAQAIGDTQEKQVMANVYRRLPASNFSKDILEGLASRHRQKLLVLPVRGVTWSDWGTNNRLSRALEQLGKQSPGVSGKYTSTKMVVSGKRGVHRND